MRATTAFTGPERFRRFYGASPIHLAALLGSLALAAYAVSFVVDSPSLTRMAVWFAAAVIGHDLVLFPAYAAGDRLLGAASHPRRRTRARLPVSPVNYVRVPTLGSGLLLLMFLPGIIEQGSATYRAATGQTQEPFSDRWLFVTALMFAVAALAYALRTAHALVRGSGRTSRGSEDVADAGGPARR